MKVFILQRNSVYVANIMKYIKSSIEIEGFYVENINERQAYSKINNCRALIAYIKNNCDDCEKELNELVNIVIEIAKTINPISIVDTLRQFSNLINFYYDTKSLNSFILVNLEKFTNDITRMFCSENGLIADYVCIEPSKIDNETVLITNIDYGLLKRKSVFYWDIWEYSVFGSPEFYSIQTKFFQSKKEDINAITLGLSYIQRGINVQRLKMKAVNMAAPCQDIFYDYEIYDNAKDKLPNLKYILWGISPYSLWYDLSLSKNKDRVLYYLPVCDSMHNHPNTYLYDIYLNNKRIFDYIFIENAVELMAESMNYNQVDFINITDVFDPDVNSEEYISEIGYMFNKNYPDTYKENIAILENAICNMQEKGLNVVFIVMPYSSTFLSYMNSDMYEKTISVLKNFAKTFKNVQLLDYSHDKRFSNDFFADCHHLNVYGANMMADIINDIL